jgi:hypothetical protein
MSNLKNNDMKTMNVGDKIKSFEVKKIVEGFKNSYDSKGNKTKVKSQFLFLLSDLGEERVLEMGKKSLRDCLTWTTTFGSKHKFIKWNQF